MGGFVPSGVIAGHSLRRRHGDETPGFEHRLLIHAWAAEASRKAVLAIVERIVAVAMSADLDGANLMVTNRVHERTDTAIDLKAGRARAAVALRMFSEPA
jgi:hypothetical protein